MFHGLVCSRLKVYFTFFLLKSSNSSFEKLMFSKGPSFFVIFLCNYEALNLRLHVVALLASVTMSWSAKTTKKFNTSRLDLLLLVRQSSNSFDLNSFFQILFSLLLTFNEGLLQLTQSGSLYSTGLFLKGLENVSVLFFVWNLQTVFPLKPMFSGGPSFFVHFICNDGALNLRLHVVDLPASVIISWPTKTT